MIRAYGDERERGTAPERILVINPGATSTKIAVFDSETPLFRKILDHRGEDLAAFSRVCDQYEYRRDLICAALEEEHVALSSLAAVVARGGLLKPVSGGAYAVDEGMLEDLRAASRGQHASNLGAVIAECIAKPLGIPALVVDPVSVDEMDPVARLSGLPELPRQSLSHALNSKAVARTVAAQLGKAYADANLIVAHLGSGVSVTPHRKGRMIDVNNAQEEGPFSPDRCGGLPVLSLIALCYSGTFTKDELIRRVMGSGGMYAYLGTRDLRNAEELADSGDARASLVLNAMAYQVSKEIGAMAAVLSGAVDSIVLTGGMAQSERLVKAITERVSFIAPVVVVPGEGELEALAQGALRVLRGEEPARDYAAERVQC
jgi:butyrate kinase